jgi:hypothetical protein
VKSPVEQMLDTVEWVATNNEQSQGNDGLPHATHEGVLSIGGMRLRCYRLSDGMAVFDADDVKKFFDGLA